MEDIEKFRKAALKQHNILRKKHGVPAVKLNDEISHVAQRWAEHLAKYNKFAHSTDRLYQGEKMGENIAKKRSSHPDFIYTGDEATNQWYREIERWDFNTATGSKTGHFTQIVWKSCREIGVGCSRMEDGTFIVVANYHPSGNWRGQYADNILPPVNGKVEVPAKLQPPNPPSKTNRGSGVKISSQPERKYRSGDDEYYPTKQQKSRYVQVDDGSGSGGRRSNSKKGDLRRATRGGDRPSYRRQDKVDYDFYYGFEEDPYVSDYNEYGDHAVTRHKETNRKSSGKTMKKCVIL